MGYIEETSRIYFSLTGGAGTLQNAIDLAQSTRKPLFIAPGSYETGDLVISGPVSVSATPGTVTLLPLSSGSTAFSLAIRSNSANTYISDVSISGLIFYGAQKNFSATLNTTSFPRDGHYDNAGNFNALLWASKVTRLTLSQCMFGFSNSNAVALWDCTATVENNEFDANRLCAVYSCHGWGTLIADNFIRSGDNAGIFVARMTPGMDGTVVRANHVYNISANANLSQAQKNAGMVSGSGWYGNGIYLLHADHAIVDQNVVLNCAFSGVRNIASWNCQITGNQIRQSKEVGLFVEAPGGTPGENNTERYEGGVVANNTVDDSGTGISVTNCWWGGRRVTVSGNMVFNAKQVTITTNDTSYPSYKTTGAGIVAEGDVVVSGNYVESVLNGPGIVLYPSGISGSTRKLTALASGNTVKQAKFGIAFNKTHATGFCFVGNNIVQGTTAGAIVPVDLPGPVYSDYVRVAGSPDYGTLSGGTYTGKPFANTMIGLNFAIA